VLLALLACAAARQVVAQNKPPEPHTVRALVQPRPGSAPKLVDMRVQPVPVDPPLVSADKAQLADDELVLGMADKGQAVAWPIRYLSLFEVLNSRAGKIPVAPTW